MKKLWILPLAAVMMVSCGGEKEEDDSKTDSVDACSCKTAAEELAKKITEAGQDTDAIAKLNDEAKEFGEKCTAGEKEGADAWAAALKECK